jgi:uncharacterized protein
MLAKSDLVNIVRLQTEQLHEDHIVQRKLQMKIKKQSDFVSIITGVRRSGKSTLLKELMKTFQDFRYLNFEDFRLAGFEPGDYKNLEAVFSERCPNSDVYFFDEIQNAPDWENYIRTLNDSGKKVYITGSNASLLSRELGTKLTGRHLEYELFPMNFFEYCTLKGIDETVSSLDGYLGDGGFPQYLKTGFPEYLQQLLKDILYRDIVRRHNIRNISALEGFTRYLISNIAKEYSLRNISKMLDTDSIHMLSEFIGYLQDAYLFFPVPIFTWSQKKQSINPRKIYSIDNGLTSANSLSFSADKGKLLENAVFLSLRQRFSKIYYFKNRGECDFIAVEKNRVHYVVQVCYSLSADNLARELRGLEEAMAETGCKNAVIVTRDEKSEYSTGIGPVQAIPAIDWFRKM